MEGNDLTAYESPRTYIVLEGVLAQVPVAHAERRLLRKTKPVPVDAHSWLWSSFAIKLVNHYARNYNTLFDVVTFISQEVADEAADYLNQYEVRVSSCKYYDYEMFCTALTWKHDVDRVIDTDPERLLNYGSRAYQPSPGGEF